MFLKIKNAAFGYSTPLIKGVETELDVGQVCLLIGNNGVGKTTLIKSILNQVPLLGGDILLEEKLLKNKSVKDIALQIAVVFSKAEIPTNYTVTDLISLGKYIHYPYYFELKAADKSDVSQIIDDLGLREYEHYPLRRLSDGNLQKAFIGRALAQNSPMIILDEPTTHLDEKNKIIILTLLRKLAKRHNKLILFSSHDWRLAKEFADKIWLIHDGFLDAGIAEELLLKHIELLNPQLFNFVPGFVPPHIEAPPYEKEMLYSFLQKNFEDDQSSVCISFNERFWTVNTANDQHRCESLQEIRKVLIDRN